jgi:agmatine deiminase
MRGRLRIPAEWERHDACWVAFPHLEEEWHDMLPNAQEAIVRLCRCIAGPGGEPVRLLVANADVESTARAALGDEPDVSLVRADYGDCWVRDTLPSFGWTEDGRLGALRFRFNGWGGKFDIPFDDEVGAWLAKRLGAVDSAVDLVLEGGALELDGEGTAIVTESCVLNSNRNPGLTRAAFEETLAAHAEVDRIVWLERGLAHDHTDGHVDMIARFTAPGIVCCMAPDSGRPNTGVLEQIRRQLSAEEFRVLELPAAPLCRAPDDTPLPATYCNFYVANQAVIVPTYGVPDDEIALDVLRGAFPGRTAIGLPARDLLCGGGSLHCATQPLPAAAAP